MTFRDAKKNKSVADRLRRAAELFLDNHSLIRASLYRFTRNRADIDELTQDVYLRMASADIDGARSPRALLLTIARNVGLDWIRHRKVVPIELFADLETLGTVDETAQAEEIVNSHQELVVLSEAVADLPPACRRAFTLLKVYGLTQKEIAIHLNISENTVEQQLAKAARRLGDALFGFDRLLIRPNRRRADDADDTDSD